MIKNRLKDILTFIGCRHSEDLGDWAEEIERHQELSSAAQGEKVNQDKLEQIKKHQAFIELIFQHCDEWSKEVDKASRAVRGERETRDGLIKLADEAIKEAMKGGDFQEMRMGTPGVPPVTFHEGILKLHTLFLENIDMLSEAERECYTRYFEYLKEPIKNVC